jgi:hypothetical protein
MQKITIEEFAKNTMALGLGASITFQYTDEDENKMDYFITYLKQRGSDCLIANCVDGGRPLIIDITTYYSDLRAIREQLDEYINSATGEYGFVTVLEDHGQLLPESNPASAVRGSHMLISVTERDISAAMFSSYESAFAQMEKELNETMDGDREGHEGDYTLSRYSAWSNTNHNATSDWLIVQTNNTGFPQPTLHIGWDMLRDPQGGLPCPSSERRYRDR